MDQLRHYINIINISRSSVTAAVKVNSGLLLEPWRAKPRSYREFQSTVPYRYWGRGSGGIDFLQGAAGAPAPITRDTEANNHQHSSVLYNVTFNRAHSGRPIGALWEREK